MMATTHALAGVALAVAVSLFVPEAGGLPVLAAAVGGFFPDFDLTGDHRKTLHFPVYYSVAAVPAGLLALLNPTTVTVAVALFLVAAAAHSASDVLGGGLELRPWEATGEKAVYVHPQRRWLRPKRLVRYDGAPEDFVVGAAFALPGLVVFDGWVEQAVLAGLVVSLAYTVVRKRLPDITPERFQ